MGPDILLRHAYHELEWIQKREKQLIVSDLQLLHIFSMKNDYNAILYSKVITCSNFNQFQKLGHQKESSL